MTDHERDSVSQRETLKSIKALYNALSAFKTDLIQSSSQMDVPISQNQAGRIEVILGDINAIPDIAPACEKAGKSFLSSGTRSERITRTNAVNFATALINVIEKRYPGVR